MAFDPLQNIVLTNEEQTAASAFIRDLASSGEALIAPEEIANEFKRALVALAILNLADALTTQGRVTGNCELVERGCASAVKAFALYPIAVNCYECARIVACSGQAEEARPMFEQFLDLLSHEGRSTVRDRFTAQHDLNDLVSGARLFLATGIAPAT